MSTDNIITNQKNFEAELGFSELYDFIDHFGLFSEMFSNPINRQTAVAIRCIY